MRSGRVHEVISEREYELTSEIQIIASRGHRGSVIVFVVRFVIVVIAPDLNDAGASSVAGTNTAEVGARTEELIVLVYS
jgi:hypothetical protein